MENSIAKAKEYYKSIGKVWCPVLNEHIVFNSIGFRHLMRSGRRRRSRADKARRFRLLRLVPEIVANPRAKIIYPKDEISPTKLWVITEMSGKHLITVVIRQVGDGNKHFFSIYN